jgi:SNF2 family DNA or RNA helicase
MPLLPPSCPKCSAQAAVVKTFDLAGKTMLRLSCTHLVNKADLNCSGPEQIVSLDNKRPYKFQCEGVRFLENSGVLSPEGILKTRALLADEMGLGKTIQALSYLLLHPESRPFLWIGKASLKTQYQHEIMRWFGEDYFAQVIDSPKDIPIPGLVGYIVSYDILRRLAGGKEKKKSKGDDFEFEEGYSTQTKKLKDETNHLTELIDKLKIKTIILDECQQIKNHESQRTIFVREICKLVPNVIALSGTPIKNHAGEYWPVLNILRPEEYRHYSKFLLNECESYYTGYGYKTGGLADPERFLAKTKSYILRRERKEVLPDLPPIVRNFQFCDLAAEVEKQYIELFKQFREDCDTEEGDNFTEASNTLAYLSKMRHLTGLSKIDPCIDYVMEIMGSTDDRITIFVHHKDVAEILTTKLNSLFKQLNIPPCARHDAGSQAMETEKKFKDSRVLICSTLAGGEGLNLQHLCFRFIMLERQWNPANEEQAEARFPRPEGLKTNSIDGTYFVAVGTVDEFFSEIVERKREIVNKTLAGEAANWDQSSIMKELKEVLMQKGGQRWSV